MPLMKSQHFTENMKCQNIDFFTRFLFRKPALQIGSCFASGLATFHKSRNFSQKYWFVFKYDLTTELIKNFFHVPFKCKEQFSIHDSCNVS